MRYNLYDKDFFSLFTDMNAVLLIGYYFSKSLENRRKNSWHYLHRWNTYSILFRLKADKIEGTQLKEGGEVEIWCQGCRNVWDRIRFLWPSLGKTQVTGTGLVRAFP